MVAPDGAHLARQLSPMHSPDAGFCDDLAAAASSTTGFDAAKKGSVAGPGLRSPMAPGRGDHVAAGLGLPPGVDDRAAPLPTCCHTSSRPRVDRLADRTQHPQAGKVVFVDPFRPCPISARSRSGGIEWLT